MAANPYRYMAIDPKQNTVIEYSATKAEAVLDAYRMAQTRCYAMHVVDTMAKPGCAMVFRVVNNRGVCIEKRPRFQMVGA